MLSCIYSELSFIIAYLLSAANQIKFCCHLFIIHCDL